jgi:hypothetical protein
MTKIFFTRLRRLVLITTGSSTYKLRRDGRKNIESTEVRIFYFTHYSLLHYHSILQIAAGDGQDAYTLPCSIAVL